MQTATPAIPKTSNQAHMILMQVALSRVDHDWEASGTVSPETVEFIRTVNELSS